MDYGGFHVYDPNAPRSPGVIYYGHSSAAAALFKYPPVKPIPLRFSEVEAKASFPDGAAILQVLLNLDRLVCADEARALLKRLDSWDDHAVDTFYAAYRAYENENNFFSSAIQTQERPSFFEAEYLAIHLRLRQLILIAYPASAAFYENPAPHPSIVFDWDVFVKRVRKYCICPQTYPPAFDLCSDWNKMTQSGQSFGGYWAYPKESDEYANAFDLTGAENLAALEQLPFPYTLVAWTILIGCNTRLECVEFSRRICSWFDDMIAKTGILTPDESERYRLNCQHLPWKE